GSAAGEGAASLREVIVYLRRERELVAAQLEVAQQEAQRWRQQATHAQRMLDDVRQELTQESEPRAKEGGSAQDSADQAQLLRESNSVLRSELTLARTRLRDVEADLVRVRDQEVPQLRSAHAALTAELGAARAQAEQLAGMCEHWKQRHEKVLAKYQMIEPEEYDALKVENAKMAADCEALRQQIADLQKHAAEAGEQRSAAQSSRVRSLQADVARLRAQIEAQLKELEEVREKSSQAEAAAAAGAREQLEAAQADVQAAQAAALASKGKYEKLHTVFTKLREQSVDKLEASNRTIKEREAAIQALTAQIEAAQEGGSDVAAAAATVAALTEEKDRAVAKQNALAEELQTAHAQLSEAREQLQARSAQVQPAADDASGGEAVRRQLAEAEAKVKEYEGQLEQLKARALRYARDNKAFQARVSELEKQLAGADGGTLQAQLDAAKQQLADAEAKIETATTNAKKSAELRSKLQISRANKRADELEKQVAALEAKIGELAPGESASLKRPNDAADGPAKKAHVEGRSARAAAHRFHTAAVRAEASQFTMPALSPTMTEGGIARWEKKEGESFSAGDLLLQIETDKAQMDVEAQDDGILVKILAPEGSQNVSVNSVIAIIAEEGDDLSSIDIAGLSAKGTVPKKAEAVEAPLAPSSAPKAAVAELAQRSDDNSAHGQLSPAVTFAIHANHIANASEISGSGPKGRILKGDVIQFLREGKAVIDKVSATHAAPVAAVAAAPAKAPAAARSSADAETAFLVQSLESSVLRRLGELELAKRSTTVQVPADKLAKLVKADRKLSDAAFALRAAALALHQVPLAKDGNTRVGVAVEGSKAPVVVEIADASTTSVLELAAKIRDAQKAATLPSASGPLAVVLAAEGVYTPATLPLGSTVLVVGKPHAVVSSAEASAALESALNQLVGGATKPKPTVSAANVFDVGVIGESPANGTFAGKVKGFLSNPELLMF
ncbi:hypothetical protein H4S07_001520, partial [Coemansia furcata]